VALAEIDPVIDQNSQFALISVFSTIRSSSS